MKAFCRLILFSVAATAACSACKREERLVRVPPSSATLAEMVQVDELHAGGPSTNGAVTNDYENNSYALSEGQQLYESFNCVGCHAHGGGGMGVPLMDDKWIYGSKPDQIFATIVEGRPKGMPSFRHKLTDHQVWELVAYVRSLSGQAPKTVGPGRDDHMQSEPPPNSVEKAQPQNVSSPE